MKTIGIIGLGSIGMRHAKNLIAMGHEVFGHDPDHSQMLKLVDAGGKAATYEEIVLGRYRHGTVIASPTKAHLKQIDEIAATDGVIFCEKPIADKLGRALSYVSMVGYNLRWHHCVIRAGGMLSSNEIGKPLSAHFIVAQKNTKPAYLRDGVILNWSHEIDLALHLLGPAKVLTSATRLTDGKDDLTDIVLKHESGCQTHIHLNYLADPEIRDFFIQGEKGNLFANLITQRFVMKRNGRGETVDRYQDTFDENYIEEMKAFIDCIDGKPHLGCTGEEALEVLKICLKVREQAGL